VDRFSMTLNASVVAVAFDSGVLRQRAEGRLSKELMGDKELDLFDISTFTFQLVSFDRESQSVEVQVYLEGKTRLRLANPILSKENFSGKTRKEVVSFLTQSPAIEDVEVRLRPFWLTRVPRLLDHVNIVIKRVEE